MRSARRRDCFSWSGLGLRRGRLIVCSWMYKFGGTALAALACAVCVCVCVDTGDEGMRDWLGRGGHLGLDWVYVRLGVDWSAGDELFFIFFCCRNGHIFCWSGGMRILRVEKKGLVGILSRYRMYMNFCPRPEITPKSNLPHPINCIVQGDQPPHSI